MTRPTSMLKHLTDEQIEFNLLMDFAETIGVDANRQSKENYTYLLLPTIHPNLYFEYGLTKTQTDKFIRVFYQDENLKIWSSRSHKPFFEIIYDKDTNEAKKQRYTPLKGNLFNEILDDFKRALSKYEFNRKLTSKLEGKEKSNKNKI